MTPRNISSRRCNVCIVEKSFSTNELRLCSGCRLIRYCSREHQRLDWNLHKSFCNAIRHILKARKISHVMELEGPITSWPKFEKVITMTKLLLHAILNRDLDNHESELLTFPLHCQICFAHFDANSSYDCPYCRSVYYCNAEHCRDDFDNHSKWCSYLKCYYDFDENENCDILPDFSKAPIIDRDSFPEDLFGLIGIACNGSTGLNLTKEPKSLDEYQHYAFISNFSCVATILYALKLCCTLSEDSDCLVIYLIGARDEYCYLHDMQCAFLASQLPTVKRIKFYLIGPELPRDYKTICYSVGVHNRSTIVEINFIHNNFENFTGDILSKVALEKMPHLIVAFNCGFYEYAGTAKDTWRLGIAALFEFDRIPIVFTSYTKLESRFDLQEFSDCANSLMRKYEIRVNGIENRFKDYRPFRNFELHDRKDLIYFRNGYLHIVVIDSKS